jgi:hypothetical protein
MARLTGFPNGLSSFLVDSNAVNKTANYTVVITTDSGKTFTSETDGIVFTLPSIAIGNTITITYAGSSTDDKDLINTKATAKRGDFVTLASLDGVVAWQVVAARGVWAKEA